MGTYYIGNMPISDDLYHHGIQGQKWGVRRYQNPDGTLTNEGKERYGQLGEYSKRSRGLEGFGRRLLTGDIILGTQRHREAREKRLSNKVNRRKESGRDASKIERKLEAQKQKNIDIEKYNSNTSTGKLFLQNYLMSPYIADRYRAGRARGEERIDAFFESILPGIAINPFNTESILARSRDKKKYGSIAHSDGE